ncbi:MAG: hypothetical protein ACREEL_05635 [Stellaceae bacterium]
MVLEIIDHWIVWQKIDFYQKELDREHDESKRAMLQKMLAAKREKMKEFGRTHGNA